MVLYGGYLVGRTCCGVFDCGCFVYVCCLLLLWVGFAVSDLLMVVGGDSYFLLMFCGYTD